MIENIAQFNAEIMNIFQDAGNMFLIGGCAALMNAQRYLGFEHRPAFDIDIVTTTKDKRDTKTLQISNFGFRIDIIPRDAFSMHFNPAILSSNNHTNLLLWTGKRSTSGLDLPFGVKYESIATLLPNKAYLMLEHYTSRLGEMAKEMFDIAMMGHLIGKEDTHTIYANEPEISPLIYASSAMMLMRRKELTKRNLSTLEDNVVSSNAQKSAEAFFNNNTLKELKRLSEQKPMLLGIMLFNTFDIYMKERKEELCYMDNAKNNAGLGIKAVNEMIVNSLGAVKEKELIEAMNALRGIVRKVKADNISLKSIAR